MLADDGDGRAGSDGNFNLLLVERDENYSYSTVWSDPKYSKEVTMRKILAIDAGGTSSRAVLLDMTGACGGFGRAGAGNPTAVGIASAVDALGLAVERALGGAASPSAADSFVVVALAGAATPPFLSLLEARLTHLGLHGNIAIEPDLLGTFSSGTSGQHGYAVIAGTGAIAARVSDGRIHTVRGGTGWLLGDTGSGFWIGQQIARAVVASLDGLGPSTVLTPLLLKATGIERTGARRRGRSEELSQLMQELYSLRPVELARFAPLAFEAGEHGDVESGTAQDVVASDILEGAASGIARVLAAAVESDAERAVEPDVEPDVGGCVVLGGSVLAAGLARAPDIFLHRLRAAAGGSELVMVQDGVVGAAVLALRHLGREVDVEFHRRLTREVDRVRSPAVRG